ncbi:hypothetical protein D9M68_431980 [compost metagenome]
MPGSSGSGSSGSRRTSKAASGPVRPITSTARARLNAVWKYTTALPPSGTARAPSCDSQGSASRQPNRRTSRLPRGRRRATRVRATPSAGKAPPRLAPSTRARAVGKETSPVAAREATSSTTATLEWQAQVSSAASNRVINGSPCRPATAAMNTSEPSMLSSDWPSSVSARSIRPRPIRHWPTLSRRRSSRRRNSTSPASRASGASSEVSKLSNCTTRVVPTLAPSMTASAGARPSVPLAVNEAAIRLAAVALCSRPVTPSPASNASQRLPRRRPSQLRNAVPKPRSTPLEIMWVPHSSKATAPARLISSVVPCMTELLMDGEGVAWPRPWDGRAQYHWPKRRM